jgi:hypothetical protein
MRKTWKEFLGVLGAAVSVAGLGWAQQGRPPAVQEKIDWKICEKEARDYGCTGTDEQIWQCLEKQDERLEGACQREHRKGDKRFGVDVEGEVRKREGEFPRK